MSDAATRAAFLDLVTNHGINIHHYDSCRSILGDEKTPTPRLSLLSRYAGLAGGSR